MDTKVSRVQRNWMTLHCACQKTAFVRFDPFQGLDLRPLKVSLQASLWASSPICSREARRERTRERGLFTISPPNGELARRPPASKLSIWGGGGEGGGILEKSRKSCTQTHERRRKCNRRSLAGVFPRGSLCSPQLESLFAGYVHVRLKEKKCLTSAT